MYIHIYIYIYNTARYSQCLSAADIEQINVQLTNSARKQNRNNKLLKFNSQCTRIM